MKICKACGALYEPKVGGCPRCETQGMAESAEPKQMTEEELKRARRRSWIDIIIGVPALIGFIYLIFYLIQQLKG